MDLRRVVPSTSTSEEKQIYDQDVTKERTPNPVDLRCNWKMLMDTPQHNLQKPSKILNNKEMNFVRGGTDWTESGVETGRSAELPSSSSNNPRLVIATSEDEPERLKAVHSTVEKTSESGFVEGSTAEITETNVEVNVSSSRTACRNGSHGSPETDLEINDTNSERSDLLDVETSSDDFLSSTKNQSQNHSEVPPSKITMISSNSNTYMYLTGNQDCIGTGVERDDKNSGRGNVIDVETFSDDSQAINRSSEKSSNLSARFSDTYTNTYGYKTSKLTGGQDRIDTKTNQGYSGKFMQDVVRCSRTKSFEVTEKLHSAPQARQWDSHYQQNELRYAMNTPVAEKDYFSPLFARQEPTSTSLPSFSATFGSHKSETSRNPKTAQRFVSPNFEVTPSFAPPSYYSIEGNGSTDVGLPRVSTHIEQIPVVQVQASSMVIFSSTPDLISESSEPLNFPFYKANPTTPTVSPSLFKRSSINLSPPKKPRTKENHQALRPILPKAPFIPTIINSTAEYPNDLTSTTFALSKARRGESRTMESNLSHNASAMQHDTCQTLYRLLNPNDANMASAIANTQQFVSTPQNLSGIVKAGDFIRLVNDQPLIQLEKHLLAVFGYLIEINLAQQLVKQNAFYTVTAAETIVPRNATTYQKNASTSGINSTEHPIILQTNQDYAAITDTIPDLSETYQRHSQLYGHEVDESYFPYLFKLYALHSVSLRGREFTARKFLVSVSTLTEWLKDEQLCAALFIPNIILDINRGEFPIIDIWISSNFMEQQCLGHLPSYQEIKHKALNYARRYPEFSKFLGDISWIQGMLNRNGLSSINGAFNFVKHHTLGMLFCLTMPVRSNPQISILFSALADGYHFPPYVITTDKKMAGTLKELYTFSVVVACFRRDEPWDEVISRWNRQIWSGRPKSNYSSHLILDSTFMASLSPRISQEFSNSWTSIFNGPVDVLVEYQAMGAFCKAHLQSVVEQMYQHNKDLARDTGEVGDLSSEWLLKVLDGTLTSISFNPGGCEWIRDCFKDCRIAEYYWKE